MQTIDQARVRGIAEDWRHNSYYERAEKEDWLAPFWGEGTPFRRCFAQLDLRQGIELACGHGRHTAQILSGRYGPIPERLVLMDVNQENVDACRARFAGRTGLEFMRNDGSSFAPLEDGRFSGIFCYDAMVHFEYDCVIAYIKDAMRVLQPGGAALFHHSNYGAAPGEHYDDNPHSRNFMTKELFAHVALRTGLEIVEQHVMDWGEGSGRVAAVDCLSLLRKPRDGAAAVPARRPGIWRAFERFRRT